VTRLVTLDFNDPAELQLAVDRHRAYLEHRQIEPPLLANLERALALVPEPARSEIRRGLDTVHPRVVLAEYWRDLIPNVPALGSYL
jgi:hypothetical protein